MRWWKTHFLAAELGLAVLVAVAISIYVWRFGDGGGPALLEGRRSDLYGTLAGIHASLLGFVLASTTIVLGLVNTERFLVVRTSQHYPTLWRIFISAIRVFAAATLASVAALLVDREPPHSEEWLMVAVAGLTVLAGLRTSRAIWILEKIITIVTSGSPQTNADR